MKRLKHCYFKETTTMKVKIDMRTLEVISVELDTNKSADEFILRFLRTKDDKKVVKSIMEKLEENEVLV